MSTRSLGCNGPLSAVRPGLDTVMLSIASAAACALRAALAAASARAWYGWPPGTNLTAMSVTMSHEPPRSRVASAAPSLPCAAYRFEKPELHLQNALFCLVAALRRPHRLDAGHRRHAGVVFARDAGIGRLRQPARRGRGQCDRVRRLLGVEMEQAGRR